MKNIEAESKRTQYFSEYNWLIPFNESRKSNPELIGFEVQPNETAARNCTIFLRLVDTIHLFALSPILGFAKYQSRHIIRVFVSLDFALDNIFSHGPHFSSTILSGKQLGKILFCQTLLQIKTHHVNFARYWAWWPNSVMYNPAWLDPPKFLQIAISVLY